MNEQDHVDIGLDDLKGTELKVSLVAQHFDINGQEGLIRPSKTRRGFIFLAAKAAPISRNVR